MDGWMELELDRLFQPDVTFRIYILYFDGIIPWPPTRTNNLHLCLSQSLGFKNLGWYKFTLLLRFSFFTETILYLKQKKIKNGKTCGLIWDNLSDLCLVGKTLSNVNFHLISL